MNQIYFVKSAKDDKNFDEGVKQIFLGLAKKIIHNENVNDVSHAIQGNENK